MTRDEQTLDDLDRTATAWTRFGFGVAIIWVVIWLVRGCLALAGATDDPLVRDITVIDGDTIRMGKERIRLNGIDAPEMPGHCRTGRACVPGDPFEAKAQLAAGFAMPGGITVSRLKTDRYGRTVAQVKVGDTDLSCWMVERGAAIYVAKWDEGRIMEASCE